jgi:hypothetical protein
MRLATQAIAKAQIERVFKHLFCAATGVNDFLPDETLLSGFTEKTPVSEVENCLFGAKAIFMYGVYP